MIGRPKRGFSLIEVLAVAMILPVFLVLISQIWLVMCRDVPISLRLVARGGTLLDAIEQIHQDVAMARSLPLTYDAYASNDENLLLDLGEQLVLYQRCANVLTKAIIQPGLDTPQQVHQWYLPDTSIRWNLWTEADKAYAVQIQTHMIYKRSQRHIRLPCAYLFFLTLPAEEVAR